MNAEIERLTAAIQTATVYLDRKVKAGDKIGILKWSLRVSDFGTRIAVAVSPPLAAKEAAEMGEPPVYDPPLTWDQEHVIFIEADDAALKALGRPYGHDGAERGALPLLTHYQMAVDLGLPLHAAEFSSAVVPGAAQ